MKINRSDVMRIVEVCLGHGARSAVVYRAPDFVVKGAVRNRGRRGIHVEMLLTAGRPNWSEKQVIARLVTLGAFKRGSRRHMKGTWGGTAIPALRVNW